ncbi:MAG: hypothetical protein VW644_03390 [Alphaproteobacteria bacterium]|jgi:uncharacterized membrane protein
MTTHTLVSPFVAVGRYLREFAEVCSEARRMAALWDMNPHADFDTLRKTSASRFARVSNTAGTAGALNPRIDSEAGNIDARGHAA